MEILRETLPGQIEYIPENQPQGSDEQDQLTEQARTPLPKIYRRKFRKGKAGLRKVSDSAGKIVYPG